MIPAFADLSADLRAAWAPEALYFAATIADDVLIGGDSPKVWEDDTLESPCTCRGPPDPSVPLCVDGRQTENGNPIPSLTVVTRTIPGGWSGRGRVPAHGAGPGAFAVDQQYPFTFRCGTTT